MKFPFDRNTLLHLRLPFSFFLMPVFFFGISQADTVEWANTTILFIALHFFIYPGSNAYNSFMDEDKGSIGGLEKPPPVTVRLYYASIVCDVLGLLLCALIGIKMIFLIMMYIGVSKAYSWKKIRLKKYSVLGWLVVILFQGGYTFMFVNMAAENIFNSSWFTFKNTEAMLLASLLIGSYYPLTQIYQHEEDSERGDYTISYRLGITGTFIFSAILFLMSVLVAFHYFLSFYTTNYFSVFILSLIPVLIYFFSWFIKTIGNKSLADYKHTMRMTLISSACLLICFTILFFMEH